MDAIDWPGLARGALWVLGLSVSLAALSHLQWAAKRDGVPLRRALSWDSFLAPFCAGLALFAVSMALGAGRLWETLAWLVLALLFIVQVALALRGMRRHASAEHDMQPTGPDAQIEEERT